MSINVTELRGQLADERDRRPAARAHRVGPADERVLGLLMDPIARPRGIA
jgi:hypothetical protein